jgi:ribonuclease-3
MPGARRSMPGEGRRRKLRALLKLSGAPHLDVAAVEPAFIHESAAHESAGRSNQRLEFFGDAVLGFVTAQYLFEIYPQAREGELAQRKTVLISGDSCAKSARRLGFGELVVVGHGLQRPGAIENTSILGDAFEAFLGALYLATDLATVSEFIRREHLALTDRSDLADPDAKSVLLELTRIRSAPAPAYFERAEGPEHDRRFTSQVRVADEVLGEGIGPTKKAAQLSAAAMAVAALRQRTPPEAPLPATSNEAKADCVVSGRVIAFRSRSKRKPHSKPKAPI